MPKASSVRWTRTHSLIALNLYRKLLFGQFHRNNPLILEVASRMGRTSSSLAMKLTNFASLDPVQRARGIKGLSGASKQDHEMWTEFQTNINELGPESEQLLHDLFTNDDNREVDFMERDKIRLEPSTIPPQPSGSTEGTAFVRIRRGQQFFRQTVLNAYGGKCCISGIAVPRLLVASHIKPWSQFPEVRLEARNGLCLSSLHDAAFDGGLITLNEELNVVLSSELRRHFPHPLLEENFLPFEGEPIRLPEKIAEPGAEFLKYHRREVFRR